MKLVEAPVNPNIPVLSPGDTVSVHVKIKEGDRERIQEFKGIIIGISRKGQHETFTVRRIAANGIGVERNFLMRSPRIDKSGGRTPRQSPPRQAFLPARTDRQESPTERKILLVSPFL
jgi:ribosomal protein L19